MRQFRIDDSEKDRILSLHESATKRQYLSEQNTLHRLYRGKGPELKNIEGYSNNVEPFLETGSKTFEIMIGSQGSFTFNGNIEKEVGDKVTLTPQTNIKIEPYLSGHDGKTEMGGNLILHTKDDSGFVITLDSIGGTRGKYEIRPTA